MQDQVAAVVVELVPDRQVVAVQLVELLDLHLGCPLAESGSRRAARDDVLEQEHEQGHPEDDDRRLDDAAGQIADHNRLLWLSDYFVKYQFSGLMVSSGFCGVTPCRLFWISVTA